MGRWKSYKEKWVNCNLCELCDTREKTVLAKGKLPCDILFVGEAPGVSENILGKPFVGPAGHLLNEIIEDSLPDEARLAFTNLIGCIPLDENLRKVHQPHKEHIKACQPRLQEFVELANPKGIVFVGKLAEKNLPKLIDIGDRPTTAITHPAAILRADHSQKALAIQLSCIRLQDLYQEL